MVVDREDNSVANDYGLKQRASSMSLMVGYDKGNDMVREVSVNSQGGFSSIGGNGVESDLTSDAWGTPRVVQDQSIIHGMFTYNVPVSIWKETFNGTERDITNASSVDGKLVLTAGGTLNDKTTLDTFRNPRYQPNRGHKFSTSVFFPNKEELGNRRLGTFTEESGAFFALKSGTLYASVRTTIQSVTSDEEYEITIPDGLDIEKGNIYDIQFQWRGVGGYFFFINNKLVQTVPYLGTRTELSMFNPANPIAFECENLGDNVEIYAGCVDISSEGGNDNGKTYGSIQMPNETGQVQVSNYNTPVIAVRSKKTVGGVRNTRDTQALYLTAYADQRAVVRVWATRDFTAITENDQSWQDFGDGHLEYIIYDIPDVGSPMSFDTTKAVNTFGARVDQDQSYTTPALFQDKSEIYITPGDMFIFTVHREQGGNTNVGVTFEFAEEI